jgi:very-short-patch-repair endonuclease
VFAVDDAYGGKLRTPLDRPLAELASRQYGVVARRQLAALGLTERAVDRRLAAGRLIPLYRAVYAVGHRSLTRRGHWMAAVLAFGPDAVLSHRSAAALWGIRGGGDTRIDVTAPGRGHGREGIKRHRATLEPEDRTTRDAIPTTSLPRTLLDLASLTPLDAVVRALEEAERLRLIDTRPIHDLLERTNGHKGSQRLERALHAYDPRHARTRSALERAFLQACAQADLPPPQINALIHGYQVDVLWPDQKLIVELDGYTYHSTRRAFERDRARDAALLTAGYRTLRVTARRLDDERAEVLAAVRRLLCVSS